MIARGRVKNGMVVLDEAANLPDDTPVLVWRDASLPEFGAKPVAETNRIAEDEHRRLLEAIDRIAALPLEGSTEPFSGADHDTLLYGNGKI